MMPPLRRQAALELCASSAPAAAVSGGQCMSEEAIECDLVPASNAPSALAGGA